ncbi:hypothetical protein ABMA10_19940 [Plantibacter sp. RU18]
MFVAGSVSCLAAARKSSQSQSAVGYSTPAASNTVVLYRREMLSTTAGNPIVFFPEGCTVSRAASENSSHFTSGSAT